MCVTCSDQHMTPISVHVCDDQGCGHRQHRVHVHAHAHNLLKSKHKCNECLIFVMIMDAVMHAAIISTVCMCMLQAVTQSKHDPNQNPCL